MKNNEIKNEILTKNLQKLITRSGSQELFAHRIGKSKSQVRRWNLGETIPKPRQLNAIAKALFLVPSSLLEKELTSQEIEEIFASVLDPDDVKDSTHTRREAARIGYAQKLQPPPALPTTTASAPVDDASRLSKLENLVSAQTAEIAALRYVVEKWIQCAALPTTTASATLTPHGKSVRDSITDSLRPRPKNRPRRTS